MPDIKLQEFKELLIASNNSILNTIRTSLIKNSSEETKVFMENQKLINSGIEKELNELKCIVATKQDVKIAMEESLRTIFKECDDRYASEKDFKFIKRLVFGFIGIIILGTLYLIRDNVLGIK
jgi:hypothetical protein